MAKIRRIVVLTILKDLFDSDQTGDADDKLDYLADYYYGDNWELNAQFQDWYYTYFGGFWVTDFEDDYV